MQRRRFLCGLAAANGVLTAGCTSFRAASEPFTFGITNWRDRRYTAEVLLRKNDDRVLFDARVDVPAHRPSDEDPRGLLIRDLTTVSDGDVTDDRVDVDGRAFETAYDITCSRNEDREMEFAGSEC